MTALTFALKIELKQRLDCSPLTPDHLEGKTLDEIAALELQCGNRKLAAGDVFAISGEDALNIVFENAAAKLDYIGKGMSRGTVSVQGDAGAYLGMWMKGGALDVSGNAGAFAACEMKNGELHIGGNAGDFLGAALPGNKKGMQGGLVVVHGNAGDRVGDHMRRGAILVEGDAGSYLGSRMTAGTVGVMGAVGAYPGYAMKRGTLLLLQAPATLSATFNDCGAHTLGFLPLLLKSFQDRRTRFGALATSVKRVRRYAGDLSELGKGEILVVL
jgi:formylmethanofuran dehydrogenase subunit C